MTSTCRDSNEGPMLSTHLAGCEAKTCAGCQPCGELHCTNLLPRGRRCLNQIEAGLICPSCIGKTRRDLGDIFDLEALLLPEAIVRGANSEAAYFAGPATDPESWSWHKVTAKQGRIEHASLMEDDDELHPYSVLGRWDMMLREEYGPRTDLRVTIVRAADYLDRILVGSDSFLARFAAAIDMESREGIEYSFALLLSWRLGLTTGKRWLIRVLKGRRVVLRTTEIGLSCWIDGFESMGCSIA